MPEIPTELLKGVSPYGLLVIVFLLVLTGRLITRLAHEDRIRDKDDVIRDLRETLRVRDEQVRVRDEQTTKLLAQSDLTVQLLQSLAREAGRDVDMAA